MDYKKFTEAYKSVLDKSVGDSELRELIRSVVEEVINDKNNSDENSDDEEFDIPDNNLTEEDSLNLKDKYSSVSAKLENVMNLVENLVTSFNDAYEQTEDENMRSELSDVGFDITELLKESLAKMQDYYVMSKRNR